MRDRSALVLDSGFSGFSSPGRTGGSLYRGPMPRPPGTPETALATVRRYCAHKVPHEYRHELLVECAARGRSITIYDCRPPWDPQLGGEWSRRPVAQLRFDPADYHWTLFCADRHSRWHNYSLIDPTPRIADLLNEIDADRTGIFWG